MSLLDENYTLDALRSFILKRLGGAIWRIEGSDQGNTDNIDQSISIALHAYSRRVPLQVFTSFPTTSAKTSYDIKRMCRRLHDKTIYTVGRVDFVTASLVVSPFTASLVGVAPLLNMEGQDFDMFLTWRKTFQRVTGIEPKWLWEEDEQMLRIYNPVHNSVAGVLVMCSRDFDHVRLLHKDWLRRAALANAKEQLGIHRGKFGGALPGPGGTSLTLDATKMIDDARAELEKLNEELFKFQTKAVPLWD
jgi:hypothetical protein